MADDRERLSAPLSARLAVVPLYLFVALLVVVPVALLLGGALGSAGVTGLAGTLENPLNTQALVNSLVQGALGAVASVAAGYPVGVLLGRYDWFGRRGVRAALVVPFLLPSLVVVLGVQDLFGPSSFAAARLPSVVALSHGLPAIVLVNLLFNAPIVALLTAVGVESASADLEESLATLGAGPARVYRHVWGPPSWTGALAGGLLAFLFSALAFAAPLLLCGPRCYTLEARVWSLVQQLLAPGEAAVLAAAMVLLLALPAAAYLLLVRRLQGAGPAPPQRARALPWRSPSSWPLLGAAAVVLALVFGLLAAVLERAAVAARPGGPAGSAWSYLFASGAGAAGVAAPGTLGATVNSLVFASVAAAIATLLAVVAGYGRGAGSRATLRLFLFLPLLVSPVVLAFALSQFWRPLLGGSPEVWLLVLLSQAVIALPFALQSLDVSLSAVPRRHREAAQSLGAPPFTAYLEAELPLVRRAVVTAGLLTFALGLGEFTATYFLVTPAFTTLPVELYHLTALRAAGPADALAGLLVLVSLVALLLVQRGESRALL